jgi:hypothetical protein
MVDYLCCGYKNAVAGETVQDCVSNAENSGNPVQKRGYLRTALNVVDLCSTCRQKIQKMMDSAMPY